MNKTVYLGLIILEISKTVIYEFWYDYVKPRNREKAKLCYMDTDCFIIFQIKEDIYTDIAIDVDIRFDISKHRIERPLPRGKKLLDAKIKINLKLKLDYCVNEI